MSRITVTKFGGIIPRLSPKELPYNCAVTAHNCDLTDGTIKPLTGISLQATTDLVDTYAGLATVPLSVAMIENPIARIANKSSSKYVYRTVSAPTAIAAGDYLYYAVRLGVSNSVITGRGCVDLLLSSGNTLNASLVDADGINVKTGDLYSTKFSNWFVRRIQLGGLTDSAGGALNGQTITAIRFLENHSHTAHVTTDIAFARVNRASTGAYSSSVAGYSLYDPASDDVLTADVDGIHVDYITDRLPFIFTTGAGVAYALSYPRLTRIPSSGRIKGRALVSTMGPREPYQGALGGRRGYSFHGRDLFAYITGRILNRAPHDATTGAPGITGWIYVPEPTVALPSPTVVGGTATDVTRSYVYTHVNEYGFESGPSPAVLKTGKPDGSWNFTAIPTWDGSNNFPVNDVTNFERQKRRIYRTPVGSAIYRYVGELDDNDTAFNDAVTDANLGAELATTSYKQIPADSFGHTQWGAGVLAAVTGESEIGFSALFAPHAWPLAQRYQITQRALACEAFGDRLFVLTEGPAVAFSGTDPANLVWTEVPNSEACVSRRPITKSRVGILYGTRNGWGLLNYNGYQNITSRYFFPGAMIPIETTVAAVDADDRLIWTTRVNPDAPNGPALQGSGYMLSLGRDEKALVTWKVPDTIFALNLDEATSTLLAAYHTTGTSALKVGYMFSDPAQPLGWTWKSKLHKSPAPVTMSCAKIESQDWDSLSTEMKKRELFVTANPTAWVTATDYAVDQFVTQGGNTYRCLIAHTSGVFATDLAALKWVLNNTIYTTTVSEGVNATRYVYLTVWADADQSAGKEIVYQDFVVSGSPVAFLGGRMSDCWQFQIDSNIGVSAVSLATDEASLNAVEET